MRLPTVDVMLRIYLNPGANQCDNAHSQVENAQGDQEPSFPAPACIQECCF